MRIVSTLSLFVLPLFVIFVIIYGLTHRVKVYDAFCRGAAGGLSLVAKILPYVAAMTVGIALLRDSGILVMFTDALQKPLGFLGIPPDIISLWLIRPFSGSASIGVLSDILGKVGVNTLTADIASTMMGSSETTFYTIALYFGAVGIKNTRHTVAVAVMVDIATVIVAVITCRLLL